MIVAVVGTGTGIGKTHVACALVRSSIERGVVAVGWKPIESGVTGARGEDETRLVEASDGVVAGPTIRLRAPLAPPLAARREGIAIDATALRDTAAALAARWPVVALELAGGLWSPFDDRLDNAEWLARLAPAIHLRTVLVAPDRLGVLHDVTAAARAAAAVGLAVHAIVLVAPATPDASTGTNLGALRERAWLAGALVVEVPRAPSSALARDPGVRAVIEHVLA